jgi:hypothetical protein
MAFKTGLTVFIILGKYSRKFSHSHCLILSFLELNFTHNPIRLKNVTDFCAESDTVLTICVAENSTWHF